MIVTEPVTQLQTWVLTADLHFTCVKVHPGTGLALGVMPFTQQTDLSLLEGAIKTNGGFIISLCGQ